ncbi:MAG TPA: T9SS type A sorting domain-containing protein [Puia sp.]|nr:T9SS type A sorting domain-containing protein [Puia sp.]
MKTIILGLCFSVSVLLISSRSEAQSSCTLTATASTTASACKATGVITVTAQNGSGNYNYTITGTNYNSTTSSNVISGLQAGIYTVVVQDIVNNCSVQLNNITVGGNYQDPRFILTETNVTCNGAANGTITVGNVQYGKSPFSYSIVAPSASNVGTTNSTGVFTNLLPGNYTVQLTDSCGGLQTRIITISNYTWSITGTSVTKLNCDSATVTLTVTDNYGNVNTSGTNFAGYQYGYIRSNGDTLWSSNYVFTFYKGTARTAAFVIKDPCNNIAVSGWVDNSVPKVNSTVSISNQTCNSFTATLSGQTNLTNPQFCLYDASNTLITCNTTGTFNSLAYGSYCINITDNCYDTTFTRCFTAIQPIPKIGSINFSNKTCSDLSVSVATSNVTNGQYCLYDTSGNVIACNTTGVFNNIAYSSYCVHVQNDASCYDTLMIKCFTVSQSVPSVNSSVSITYTCNTFTANLGGQSNLTNPQFCLYDSANNQITCNATGQFTNLAYGSYCIKMTNDSTCYDTTITRCFTASAIPASLNVTAGPSCTIGATNVNVKITNGNSPYIISIYDDQGNLLSTYYTSNNSSNANALPVTGSGINYKVVVAGSCGSLDSTTFTAKASTVTKSITSVSKCPGASSQNGLGDLFVTCVYNGGTIMPKIISQDGSAVNINYSSVSSSTYTFVNLSPAIYIVQYSLQGCSNYLYDTFTLKPYIFPSLDKSAVYQCNNNSFSVSAAVTGGITPYTYAIIGSLPSLPSIIQGPQASPVFTINNGNAYSVVRLRAIDACGNATINDASILPLANIIIKATSNCIHTNTVLAVDSIANATYTWYKKTSPTDSVMVGTGATYNIPYLSVSDTGTYVNVESVNAGCLTQISTYYVDGICMTTLAITGINFTGALEHGHVNLNWKVAPSFKADKFFIERSADGLNFETIGNVAASSDNLTSSQYLFSDASPEPGKDFYRLRIVKANSLPTYTNIIEINYKGANANASVTPNPVENAFNVRFSQSASGNYILNLINPEGKIVMTGSYSISPGETKTIQRKSGLTTGIYFLVVQNMLNNDKEIIKIFFK